ncbi:MAG: phosphotransacetylase family protein [Chloroflexi bacterium]|nr:phosphotransacetylase family protein [Chloroflexota bacterium]
MGTLLVTSLHEGDGKTAFCAGLAVLLRQRGRAPGLFKLFPTAGQADDPDARFYRQFTGVTAPDLPLPAEAMGEGLSAQAKARLTEAVQQLSVRMSPIILEGPSLSAGPGGLAAGVRALAEALDARVALVVQPAPSLTAARVEEAARSLGTRLAGVVINGVRRYQSHSVDVGLAGPLHAAEIPVLACIPEDRRLVAVTVGEIAGALQGEFVLLEEKQEQLVDHLMIGGNVLDWGVHYFSQEESKAVIVRGDRPDIQMAALHTPTRCLVLTGGHGPLQYVRYEAQEEGVPLVLVRPNTLETARAAEALFTTSTIHHPEKAERYAQLLAERMDAARLVELAGA